MNWIALEAPSTGSNSIAPPNVSSATAGLSEVTIFASAEGFSFTSVYLTCAARAEKVIDGIAMAMAILT